MKTKKGFTLIELLVVIAIIAILAAILFPVFAKARAKAQQVTCLSNIKQLTLACVMYMGDNEGGLPATTGPDSWNPYFYCVSPNADAATVELHGGTMAPYFKGAYQGANYIATADNKAQSQIIVCPNWKADQSPMGGPYSDGIYITGKEMEQYMSYGSNAHLAYQNIASVGDPTSMVMVVPTYNYTMAEYPYDYIRPAFRHGDRDKGNFGFMDGHAKLMPKADIWDTADPYPNWTNWRLDPVGVL